MKKCAIFFNLEEICALIRHYYLLPEHSEKLRKMLKKRLFRIFLLFLRAETLNIVL